jgi:HPt (histidine-containing phosphotransfer) domain-containing protein
MTPTPQSHAEVLAPNPLDEQIIGDLRTEGGSLFADLVDLFLADAPAGILEISDAFAGNDLKTVALLAHRLKGSALTFGARKLGELCQGLELAGKAGELAKAQALFNQLTPECSRVSDALRAERKNC